MKPEDRFYVYIWTYSDGIVFYVGKGTGTRYKQHEWEARRFFPEQLSSNPVCAVIQQIWLNGDQPICTIVCDHMTNFDACQLEKRLIVEHDGDKLVNIRLGGLAGSVRRTRL